MTWPPRCARMTGRTGAGDVERAEEVRLHLRPELVGADVLEVPGVEVAGVVDEHVDAAEPVDGRLGGGVAAAGSVMSRATASRFSCSPIAVSHPVRVAAGGDHGVAGGECGLGDVDAETAAGAGDEPDLAVCCVPFSRRSPSAAWLMPLYRVNAE